MLRDLFSLFPAYAGVILTLDIDPSQKATFPRIRGGDPAFGGNNPQGIQLFPAYAGVILLGF